MIDRWKKPESRNPYEWWADRPRWLKIAAGFVSLGLAATFWELGWIWPWGVGLGSALLVDACFLAD